MIRRGRICRLDILAHTLRKLRGPCHDLKDVVAAVGPIEGVVTGEDSGLDVETQIVAYGLMVHRLFNFVPPCAAVAQR